VSWCGGWWAGGEQDLLVCRVRFVGVDRQGLSLLVVDLPEVLTMRSANSHNEKTKKKEKKTKNESETKAKAKNETYMSLLTVCEWLYMSAQGTMPYEPNPTM
jgi:hypothetical protein